MESSSFVKLQNHATGNHATGKHLSVTNECHVSMVYQNKPEENIGEGHLLWKIVEHEPGVFKL